MTTGEVAKKLRISANGVLAAVQRGSLIAAKAGKIYLFDPQEVDRYRRLPRLPGRPKGPKKEDV